MEGRRIRIHVHVHITASHTSRQNRIATHIIPSFSLLLHDTYTHAHLSTRLSRFQQPHQHITNSMYISMCKHTLCLFHTEDLPARPSARAALPPMLETDISLSLSLFLSFTAASVLYTYTPAVFSLFSLTHSLTHSLSLITLAVCIHTRTHPYVFPLSTPPVSVHSLPPLSVSTLVLDFE